jgi:HEAT repeat protein
MRRSTPHGDDGGADPGSRRRRAGALAGHRGDQEEARALATDPDPAVRATALGALARMGRATPSDVSRGLADPDAHVRRRACEVAGRLAATPAGPVVVVDALARALDDDDGAVVEAAAWGLGEHGGAAAHPGVLDALARVATSHQDPLCREAAVAALGAVGDRPAVRRRAVLALAPFEGPEVDQALERARLDRDWQVRQAAEDLLDG